jgi:hypothetical protein
VTANISDNITCTNLRALADAQGIVCNDTVRLYWGLYGYCLKTQIPEQWVLDRKDEIANFWSKTTYMEWKDVRPTVPQIQRKYKDRINALIDDFVERNDAAFGAEEYYSQVTAKRVSFYFKSAKTVWLLLNNNPDFFDLMWTPADALVEENLGKLADTHMQVRKELWYHSFDYMIDFKNERCFDELDDRVKTLFLSNSFYSVSPRSRSLYLAGEDEYFLVKLALWDKIGKVTACVLQNEAPVAKSI